MRRYINQGTSAFWLRWTFSLEWQNPETTVEIDTIEKKEKREKRNVNFYHLFIREKLFFVHTSDVNTKLEVWSRKCPNLSAKCLPKYLCPLLMMPFHMKLKVRKLLRNQGKNPTGSSSSFPVCVPNRLFHLTFPHCRGLRRGETLLSAVPPPHLPPPLSFSLCDSLSLSLPMRGQLFASAVLKGGFYVSPTCPFANLNLSLRSPTCPSPISFHLCY